MRASASYAVRISEFKRSLLDILEEPFVVYRRMMTCPPVLRARWAFRGRHASTQNR
jgi:hypothetical protein